VKSAREAKVDVMLGLADEEPDLPHPGKIDFIDNSVDPMTGTLELRGVFPNSQRILLPGNFARVRTPVGDPHESIMVAEKALGSDQGEKFLYVVNKKKNDKQEVEYRVEYRHVETGALRGGLRVISQGLKGGELVVVSGLQRIKRGDPVTPKEVKMPGAGRALIAAEAVPTSPAVKPQGSAKAEGTTKARSHK
jgi:RND family efflux transporter MFP subunit